MARFKRVSADDVIDMLKGRYYRYAQVHHTYKPNHADFTGGNHISLQNGMYEYHVFTRGWSDIGQHLTLFPDGQFVTGRDFDITPAGIRGYNTGSFMIEIIGDFDKGKDKLEGEQLNSALKVYNYLINECSAKILFHREKAVKSCPGTGISKSKFVSAVKNFDGNTKTVDVEQKTASHTVEKESDWVKVTGNWTGQTLGKGEYGKPVRQLQNKLANNDPPFYPEKGAKNNGVDSYYGDKTADAVGRYQSYYGLTVDELAGKEVYNSLSGNKASSGDSKGKTSGLPTGVFNTGDRGSDVRKVQEALASVYFYPNKSAKNNGIDGIYGPNTKDAVRRFQSVRGLTQDGIYGPATRKALLKAMS